MNIELRIPHPLYEEVVADLRRPHSFAWERVGFFFGKCGSAGPQLSLVLLNRYHSIPDEQYLEDESVGARIGDDALAQAMRDLYYGRAEREGIFHVHVHEHEGETGMSRTDARELPRMMPGFQTIARESAHGILILSKNHGKAWVWLPGDKQPTEAQRVVITGSPLYIFEEGRKW